jgi:HAD superfamily hydrolase (TIGR01459 family)
MPAPSSIPPIIDGVAGLSPPRRAWICDIWGVMHNGVTAFEAAADACIRFRKAGGTVLLLTNAPRPAHSVVAQMVSLGVPDDAYDLILTSGDMTRTLIERQLPKSVFHLGPPRDKPLFAGFDIRFEGSFDAGFVVCTGLFNDERETPGDYEELLGIFLKRKLAMICANPDIKVERGSNVVYCAGAIAERYRDMGGSVTFAGKPHLPVYEHALDLLSNHIGRPIAKSEVLAIGDGVHTDIAGAVNAGIDALFVASRIHVEGSLGSEALGRLFPAGEPGPVAAMTSLRW